jgi:ABC-2 type transport system permease protein
MSRFLKLTKILLKTGNGFWLKDDKKTPVKRALFFILIIVAFVPMAVGFGTFVGKAYDVLAGVEQQGAILSFGFSIVSLVIFFFGIFYTMSIYYFSMDIESLLPLPFRSSEILGAKFISILIYEYYTEILFFLPVIIVFGIKDGGGIIYYIFSLILFLFLPIIPLVMSGTIVMVVMRFSDIAKNKDRFRVIGGIIAILFGVSLNLILQRNINTTDPEQLSKIFSEGNNSFVNIASGIFPTTKLAVNSLINSNNIKGLMNLLLFLTICALIIVIFMFLGELLYFKGVVGVSETISKRKKLSSKELNKSLYKNSPIKSYTLKELKILFRTPAYFINCILMNFLWPIFLIIPIFIEGEGFSTFKKIGSFLQLDNKYISIVLAGVFAFLVFIATSNAITSTAISREGNKLFITKCLPLRYEIQLISKVLSGFIVSFISIIIMSILVIVLFRPSIYLILMILTLGIVGTVFSCMVGIFIDLNYPKLTWDSEQKAVKQNMNVMLHMLICIVIGVLTIFLVIKFKLSLNITFISLLILFSFVDVVLYYKLITKGVKIFKKIEV